MYRFMSVLKPRKTSFRESSRTSLTESPYSRLKRRTPRRWAAPPEERMEYRRSTTGDEVGFQSGGKYSRIRGKSSGSLTLIPIRRPHALKLNPAAHPRRSTFSIQADVSLWRGKIESVISDTPVGVLKDE